MAVRHIVPALVTSLAMGLALSGAAAAQSPQEDEELIEVIMLRPVAFAPVPERWAWLGGAGPYYPDRAARSHVAGEVILGCRIGAAGALEGCVVLNEEPTRYDFGDAALLMARKGHITAAPIQDAPAPGGQELFRVPFKAGEQPDRPVPVVVTAEPAASPPPPGRCHSSTWVCSASSTRRSASRTIPRFQQNQ